MMVKYITMALCLFVTSCNGCSGSKGNLPAEKPFHSQKDIIAQLQGNWFCREAIKSNTSPLEGEWEYDRQNENYGKEFVKYACFTIINDTLKGMGVFGTPISVADFQTTDGVADDVLRIVKEYGSSSKAMFIVEPVHPYDYYQELDFQNLPLYIDSPLNKTKIYSDGRLIVYDRGFYFVFLKDKNRTMPSCKGVPGDERNYFEVKKRYCTSDIKKVVELFREDYPYGAEKLFEGESANNMAVALNHDWGKNKLLKVCNTYFPSGQFVLRITMEQEYFELLYYKTDDYDHYDEGAQEWQG